MKMQKKHPAQPMPPGAWTEAGGESMRKDAISLL